MLVRDPLFDSALTAYVFCETLEWSCNCGGELDPCAHIVAALHLLVQAPSDAPRAADGAGATTPQDAGAARAQAAVPTLRGTVGYALQTQRSTLTLSRRLLLSNGALHPITRLSQCAQLCPDAVITLDETDRSIEYWCVETPDFMQASMSSIERLFGLLKERRGRVTLDDQPIDVDDEPRKLEGRVSKFAEGWRLQLALAKDVIRVFLPGVARTRDKLVPQLGLALLGGERQVQQVYAPRAVVDLVCNAIPRLSASTHWVSRSKELPAVTERLSPWIQFELTHSGRSVTVMPWLVYGEPPCARIESNKLLYLQGPIAKRREAEEVQLAHKLREELSLIVGKPVTYEGDDVAKFLKRMKHFAQGQSTGLQWVARGELLAKLRIHDDVIDLVFEEADAKGEATGYATADSVMAAWEAGLDVVALEGGGFGTLPEGWMQKHGALVTQLLAGRDAEGKTSRAAAPAVQALCDVLETPAPVEFARLAPLWGSLDGLPRAPIASDFTAQLRAYQQQGVDWLEFLRDAQLGGILADDMGLGKTVQCLAMMKGRTLVVCPRSVMHNWLDEAAKFRPAMRARSYHGEARVLDPTAELTVTTYATMRMDVEELSQIEWDCVILDEAQAIKNPDSQAARAAFALKAKLKLALSGTPIENSLNELWSLMHFAVRGLLGGRSSFESRVAKPIAEQSQSALEQLRKRIRPFVLRRTKAQVLSELPQRTEHVLRCELDPHERAVYDAVRASKLADALTALREGRTVMMALEVLLRLRQASCHPALVPGQRDPGESSKVLALMEGLENAVGASHKALVFSQWTSFLDLIEPHLRARSIRFTRLDGSTRDRGAVVKDFQAPEGPSVLLATLKAGGTGLNLTAADHVFILDPWFNPAAEQQAMDRAHRMGQTNAVSVYRLIARDTVEEQILALQSKKKALAEAALDEQTLSAALMRDDLLALLEGA